MLSVTALLGAPAATAQTSPENPVSTLGTAPACIDRVVNEKANQARITNVCGRTMKVKVVVDNYYDSSCTTLRNGQYLTYSWSWGSYDRTVTC